MWLIERLRVEICKRSDRQDFPRMIKPYTWILDLYRILYDRSLGGENMVRNHRMKRKVGLARKKNALSACCCRKSVLVLVYRIYL